MSYKIFISHAGEDAPIAEAVRNNIDKAFGENIELFLAQSDIRSAAEWKTELMSRLDSSDAIICILTSESVQKPWIYIEWSPFWLNSKPSFIFHMNDISINTLISPMQERQATNITDVKNVTSLFRSLAKEAKAEMPPNSLIAEFISAIDQAQNTKLENLYYIYRKNISKLPTIDTEKVKIAKYFYDNGDIDDFIKVSKKIRNDSFKMDFITEVLDDSKFDIEQELKIVSEIVESINSADKVGEVAILLIKLGNLDSPIVREIIDALTKRNRAELRKVAVHLVDTDQEDTELFSYICENMRGNFAEFRKIIEHMISAGKFQKEFFFEMIEMFGNFVEVKKIGNFMINNDQQRSSQFETVIKILFEKSPLNYKALMKELILTDRVLYDIFTKRYGVTED